MTWFTDLLLFLLIWVSCGFYSYLLIFIATAQTDICSLRTALLFGAIGFIALITLVVFGENLFRLCSTIEKLHKRLKRRIKH